MNEHVSVRLDRDVAEMVSSTLAVTVSLVQAQLSIRPSKLLLTKLEMLNEAREAIRQAVST